MKSLQLSLRQRKCELYCQRDLGSHRTDAPLYPCRYSITTQRTSCVAHRRSQARNQGVHLERRPSLHTAGVLVSPRTGPRGVAREAGRRCVPPSPSACIQRRGISSAAPLVSNICESSSEWNLEHSPRTTLHGCPTLAFLAYLGEEECTVSVKRQRPTRRRKRRARCPKPEARPIQRTGSHSPRCVNVRPGHYRHALVCGPTLTLFGLCSRRRATWELLHPSLQPLLHGQNAQC